MVPTLPGINTDTPYQSGTVKHRKGYLMEAVIGSTVVDTGSKVHADSVDLAAEGSVMQGFGLPMTKRGADMSVAMKRLLLKGCKPNKVDYKTGLLSNESWLVDGEINTVYLYASNPRLPEDAPIGSRPISGEDNFGLSLCLVQNPKSGDFGVVMREKVDELIPIDESHRFTWARNAEGGFTQTVTLAKPGDPIIVGINGAKWVPWTALDEDAWLRRAKMEEAAGKVGHWFMPAFELVATKRVSDAEQGVQILQQARRAYQMQVADRYDGHGTAPEFFEVEDLIGEIAF